MTVRVIGKGTPLERLYYLVDVKPRRAVLSILTSGRDVAAPRLYLRMGTENTLSFNKWLVGLRNPAWFFELSWKGA